MKRYRKKVIDGIHAIYEVIVILLGINVRSGIGSKLKSGGGG